MSSLILGDGIFRCLSALIECLCMAPRTPTMMVMIGLTFHPLSLSVCIRGLYLLDFLWMAVPRNMSQQ